MIDDGLLDVVLNDLELERHRQDAKWGEQNHRNGTGPGVFFMQTNVAQTAAMARSICDEAHQSGYGTWVHIIWEEVAEALEESDPVRLRAELIQVAAVAVSWCEAIDRRVAEEAAKNLYMATPKEFLEAAVRAAAGGGTDVDPVSD